MSESLEETIERLEKERDMYRAERDHAMLQAKRAARLAEEAVTRGEGCLAERDEAVALLREVIAYLTAQEQQEPHPRKVAAFLARMDPAPGGRHGE